MSALKISVVTPSLNQGEFIEETIKSVLDQDYPNLEYVIIDGGSTDGSVEIIKKYENKINLWVSEEDKGHGDAINKGFSNTTGDVMAWINSDDMYMPGSFRVVAEIFEKFPHIMWIVGCNSWLDQDGKMTRSKRVPKNIYDFLLGRYQWIQQESVFWRRSLWEKAGGHISQDYEYMVDGELWSRFFLHADLYTVDSILAGYRMHSNNRARKNNQLCIKEMDKVISQMRKECPEDILSTSSILNISVKNLPFWKCLPVSLFFRKFIHASSFSKADYKNISWKNDKWVERTLPFL